MNAEIKNNKKLIINRLDDAERILLSNIYDNYISNEGSVVSLQPITDSDGDFGGLTVNIDIKGQPIIVTDVPSKINLCVGETLTLIISTNVPNDNVIILTNAVDEDTTNSSYTVSTHLNTIKFTPTATQTLGSSVVAYSIKASGYTSYEGTINVNIVAKDQADVVFKAKDSETQAEINTATFTLRDTFDTIIYPSELGNYKLATGDYSIKVQATGYETALQDIVITDNDLASAITNKIINLTAVE